MAGHTPAAAREGGFTLLEMLISVGIGAMMLSVLVMVLWQVNTFSRSYGDSSSADHQLQGAATWLNRDAVAAQSGSIDSSSLTLCVPTYSIGETEPVTTTVGYALVGGDLIRTSQRPGTSSSMVVARNIETIDFGPAGGALPATINITVTAIVRDETRSTALSFYRRVTE
ncbi:MAG: PulJ/GspJ family protein [Anaerolineae bacterium]